MPDTTRRYGDLLDDHGQVTERVRKLEIMPKGRTIVPKRWLPPREQIDAIVGHIILIGVWDRNRGWDGTMPAWVSPAAQYLWAASQQEGYGGHPAIGQQWTQFLQKLGALPPISALQPINIDAAGLPPGVPPVSEDDVGYPHTLYYWPGSAGRYPGYGDGMARVISLTGLPPGTWTHWDAGTSLHGGELTAPDLGSLYRYDDPAHSGSGVVIEPGGLMASHSPDPITRRDNTYGFSTQTDCGGPNEPGYNPYTYPGMPIEYDSGSNPCPAGAGSPFTAGSIHRVSLWLPGLDLYMAHPPMPYHVGLPGAGDEIQFSAMGAEFEPIAYLREWVPYGLAEFGQVQGFYQRHLGRALAQQTVSHHYNHLSLHLNPAWHGRIEVQIHDQIATLRGTVILSSAEPQHDTDNIAAWPVAYREPVSPTSPGGWPADYGYLLPLPAGGSGAQTHFEGRLGDGTPVPMLLNPPIRGVAYIGIVGGWINEDDRGTTHADLTLTLDGATIPLSYA